MISKYATVLAQPPPAYKWAPDNARMVMASMQPTNAALHLNLPVKPAVLSIK
jgi:hypothetical protein